MTPTKITKKMRDALTRYVQNKIGDPESEQRREEAEFLLSKALLLYMAEVYPQKDMEILQKYGTAYAVDHVDLYPPRSLYYLFASMYTRSEYIKLRHTFGDLTLDGVLVPLKVDCSGGLAIIENLPEEHSVLSAWKEWKDANRMRDEAVQKVRGAFMALIQNSEYVEDLVAMWPEVPGILGKVKYAAPVQFDDDLKTVIQRNLQVRGITHTTGDAQ